MAPARITVPVISMSDPRSRALIARKVALLAGLSCFGTSSESGGNPGIFFFLLFVIINFRN